MSVAAFFVARRALILLVLSCSVGMCTDPSSAVAATRTSVVAR